MIILIAVFGALTLYVLSSLAVLKLRRIAPELARPYKTPLYPFAPIVALVLSLVCLVAMIWTHPSLTIVYVAIVAAAWLLFVVFVPSERRAVF